MALKIAFALAGLTSCGCAEKLPPIAANTQAATSVTSANDLPKVTTVKPIRQAIEQKTEQPAQVEAYSTTHIQAKTSGFVDRLLVDIGDRVEGPQRDASGKISKPGSLLMVLAAPELMDELAEKEAMVARAKSDIEQAQAAVRVAEASAQSAEAGVQEAEAGRQRAEADYLRWQSEADRIRQLAASQTVTQALADETTQKMKAAQAGKSEVDARVRSAEAKFNEAKISIGKSSADVRSFEARLRIAEAELRRARSLADYLMIRAPFDGVITERNIDVGALVHAARSSEDKPLLTVVQADRLRVFIDVPETDAALVREGCPATIKVQALGSRLFSGTVKRTAWALQVGTRTMRAEVEISNEKGELRPGMYAHVQLIVAQKSNVLTLPKTALIQHDGQAACLTVDSSGTIVRKAVATGIRSATDVEIVSGLDGSEEVIAANASAFKPDQKVQKASK